ncbi:Transposase [Lactococcus piscium MKFS47]|uniref:Transposase n=1 Tax=Pseudolactococcus piscium MKFS47 TaxID=297352 RepID=A0A0D6DXH6_9LACT|nr:Transposase [Lactococcus piscium MKFS47]CEN28668.1 Transposase [Lactococcus piscium MKFS47]
MAKYSFDLKLKAVIDYEQGLGSYQFIADKYPVKTSGRIKDWVHIYQTFGSRGLQRKRQNTVYDTQFKLNAVNLYLTSEKSYREIGDQLGMTNNVLLTRWVLDYREKGEFAFSNSRGRPRKEPDMSKQKSSKQPSDLSETEQKLAQLQNENLKLRIENEYLKGLRRLRMERQAKENPSLFRPSKENSSSHSKKS